MALPCIRRHQIIHQLRDGEQPDQRGEKMDAGKHVGIAEGEARRPHYRIQADGDDHQPDNRRQQPLDQRARREGANHREAKQHQAEQVGSVEFQRDLGQARGDEVETEEAEHATRETGDDRCAERLSGLAANSHWIAVDRRRRGRRRARDVEQDGRKAAPHHAADIEPEQQRDRKRRFEHEGQRQNDNDSGRDGHPGDHADDKTEQCTECRREQTHGRAGLEKALKNVTRHPNHTGRTPRGSRIWKPLRKA